MPPRLLFVNHSAALGGAELSLLDIAQRTPGARVVLFEDGPFRLALESAGVEVEVLPAGRIVRSVSRAGGLIADFAAAPGALALAVRLARRARTADLIYVNTQKAALIGAIAGRLARRPVLWHLRDILSNEAFSPAHRRLAGALANGPVARTLVNSSATRDALLSCGARADRVAMVYNGIDPAEIDAATEADGARLRADLGLEGVPVVGVFSRLAMWKGQHVLAAALARLPGVHALVVGDALFAGDTRYPDALVAYATRLGVADRLHLVGFRRDVPALLRAVDVVAHTSTEAEPFGRVVVEAMLARRPIVATRAGGPIEIVDDGETGVLTEPGDAADLAGAVAALLADPERARRIADAGRAAALARFTVDRVVGLCHHHAAEVVSATTLPNPSLSPSPV